MSCNWFYYMNRVLSIIVAGVIFSACNQLSETEKELSENINKTLHLNMFDHVQQVNTLMSFEEFRNRYQFFSVVYLQNACDPCYPKFIKWQKNMDSIETPESYTVLFIYRGDSYEEFMTRVLDIEYVEDKFYMVMAPEGNFLEQNNDIPRWISDASVLIDAENKIKMVGAPWANEDMTKLFYKTLNHE